MPRRIIHCLLLQEVTSLKEQLQTATNQVAQLRQDVQALDQKSTQLQAELTQAESAHDMMHQQLEVCLVAF